MLCPNCETANRDGAKFCDECGFPLTGAIAARAAEAASQAVIDATPETVQAPETESAEEPEQEPQPALESEPDSSPDRERVHIEDATEAIILTEEAEFDEPIESPVDDNNEALEENKPVEELKPKDYAPDITIALGNDLAGLDVMEDEYGERIVGPDYKEPKANWRDGHTMQMPRIEGEEAPRSKDFLASSTVKQGTNKKAIIGAIVAVVVIAAIIAFATYQMELWGGKAIPNVKGMTEADATSVLEDNGFVVRATKVKSDDTEGLVLLIDPSEGSRANEGDEIVIHIATAREIPDVIGKTEEEAKAIFKEDGYENVTYEKERSDSPEGTVLSVSPEAGTRAKSSLAVTVKVAEPYIVPDTSTLDLDGAITAIQDAGLNYDIAYVETQDYVEGTVLGTEPAAGTKVESTTYVVIEVARARGIQLTELTKGYITSGTELNIDGTSYIVSSLGSVEYLGGDQVAFTASARPYTYFFGVYVEGDTQQISGVITFTEDNQVESIS